jgi:nucleotide-binding universal stress UspA family protein
MDLNPIKWSLSDLHSGVSSSTERAPDDDGGCRRPVAYRNLLVPIDFSEHSKKTIEYATQLAAFTDGSIKILHVLQMPENLAAFYEGIYIEHEVINTHVETVKRKANDQLSLVTEQMLAKGLKAQPALRVGNPYEEIVSAANEMGADLIVIGSHGHGGLGRLLLGSTAERVLQYAPCAVLVVKGAAVDPIAGRETAEVRED